MTRNERVKATNFWATELANQFSYAGYWQVVETLCHAVLTDRSPEVPVTNLHNRGPWMPPSEWPLLYQRYARLALLWSSAIGGLCWDRSITQLGTLPIARVQHLIRCEPGIDHEL